MFQNQLTRTAQMELETVTAPRPPKLKGSANFSSWKNQIKSFFEYTDYNQWISITVGPHVPMTVRDDMRVVNNNPLTYTDKDKALIQRDRLAHAALTMAISTNDYNMFEEYTTANELWLALIDFYEGDKELIRNKRDMVQKEYDMFSGVRGESLSCYISRFRNMMAKMKKAGNPITNRGAIRKLLDSFPKEWSLKCMTIKQHYLNNLNPITLSDVIDTLETFERDQVEHLQKSVQFADSHKNFTSATPTTSNGSSPQAAKASYFNNASSISEKAPQSDVKTTVVDDAQAIKKEERSSAASEKLEEKILEEAMKMESNKEKDEENLENNIPYEFKVKLCSQSCVNVVAHYKSLNRDLIRDKEKVLQFNKELKENEAAYQRKLNSTLAEMQTLKEFVFRKDFVINDLTERLEKSQNENNRLQIIIDKWNVSKKALVDIKNCQRPTYVKDGIGSKISLEMKEKSFFLHIAKTIEREKDGCDDDCGGTKIGIGYSGDSYSTVNWFAWNCDKANKTSTVNCNGHVPKPKTHNHDNVVVECPDLNSAFCDEKVVCESPVFVPELKQNRFGKFLTEEIPEFVPSHTSTSESEKELNEESSSNDTNTTTSDGSEGSSSDDHDPDFQSYQECESSNDSETSVTDTCKTVEDLEPSSVQEPTTSNDITSPVNQDPLEEHLVIEDCTSSDDESVLNESLGESKIKISSKAVEPHVCQHAESSSKQSPPLVALHGTAKSQKPFKACFRCGKEGHVLKQCPERHDPDGKGNQYCFSGSKGKNHTSLKGQMKNFQSRSPHVKPVSHDSKIKRTNTSKPQSFPPGLKHKIISNFNSFTNKIFKPTQVWRVKQVTVKEINEGKDLVYREVSYFDERGQPKTTMAWVLLSN
ncbi:putative transcription factor interactor and regulator CCHC(Zn) family [Helianthus annuus]|nr:putative transcription factor interactor and regulator CCHC(Zn) family [Helianthus annuus]